MPVFVMGVMGVCRIEKRSGNIRVFVSHSHVVQHYRKIYAELDVMRVMLKVKQTVASLFALIEINVIKSCEYTIRTMEGGKICSLCHIK